MCKSCQVPVRGEANPGGGRRECFIFIPKPVHSTLSGFVWKSDWSRPVLSYPCVERDGGVVLDLCWFDFPLIIQEEVPEGWGLRDRRWHLSFILSFTCFYLSIRWVESPLDWLLDDWGDSKRGFYELLLLGIRWMGMGWLWWMMIMFWFCFSFFFFSLLAEVAAGWERVRGERKIPLTIHSAAFLVIFVIDAMYPPSLALSWAKDLGLAYHYYYYILEIISFKDLREWAPPFHSQLLINNYYHQPHHIALLPQIDRDREILVRVVQRCAP